MFTGIIQEIGAITNCVKPYDVVTFTIENTKIAKLLKIGDSISVDGACLTVVRVDEISFDVQAIPETLQRTISNEYTIGRRVNLEPAMQITDRFHGHMVSGHVDFVGTINEMNIEGEAISFNIQFPSEYRKYFAVKGSVTVNGVSLTISNLQDDSFEVQIIPHTQNTTTLDVTLTHNWKNHRVNIEVDLISRYLDGLLQAYARTK